MQVITPNPEVPCTPGWCLTYVDNAFNLAAHGKTKNYPTAIAAWNASTSQHKDQDFPANCWVPVWFTLKNEPAGHVAILAPDGAVWSSSHPTEKKPVRHGSLNEIVSYYESLGLKFIGWTEDVGGVAVIRQKEEIVKPTEEEVWKQWYAFGEGTPTDKQVAYYMSQPWNVLNEDLLVWNRDKRKELAASLAAIKPGEAEKKLQVIKDALDIK